MKKYSARGFELKRRETTDGEKGQTGRHPFGENANSLGHKTLRLRELTIERWIETKSERGRPRERHL
jgi:hypothetical protein